MAGGGLELLGISYSDTGVCGLYSVSCWQSGTGFLQPQSSCFSNITNKDSAESVNMKESDGSVILTDFRVKIASLYT